MAELLNWGFSFAPRFRAPNITAQRDIRRHTAPSLNRNERNGGFIRFSVANGSHIGSDP